MKPCGRCEDFYSAVRDSETSAIFKCSKCGAVKMEDGSWSIPKLRDADLEKRKICDQAAIVRGELRERGAGEEV